MIPIFQQNPNAGGGGSGLSFELPLNDAGAGIVNITPLTSLGSPTPTFTRATTAYTRLSTGVWALIASGQPRSIYSAAGLYLGYQCEGARANVLGGTDAIVRTMSDVGWVAGATMTVGTAVGVDGVADACALLTGGAVTATNTILFTTVLASAARTYSVRVRRVSGTSPVNITDNNGTNWTALTGLSTTEQLFQITRTQANPVVGVQVEGNGDSVAVDFNTLEGASFANPTPIPVNVSKAADVLTYVTAGNYDGTVGSIYAEVVQATNVAQMDFIHGGSIPLYANTTPKVSFYDGTTASNGVTYVASATSPVKMASSFGGSSAKTFSGGTASSSLSFDGNAALTSIGVAVGTTSASQLYGAIKNIRIWKTALPDAALQAMTT